MIINSAHSLSKVAEYGQQIIRLLLLEYLYSLLQTTQQTGLRARVIPDCPSERSQSEGSLRVGCLSGPRCLHRPCSLLGLPGCQPGFTPCRETFSSSKTLLVSHSPRLGHGPPASWRHGWLHATLRLNHSCRARDRIRPFSVLDWSRPSWSGGPPPPKSMGCMR